MEYTINRYSREEDGQRVSVTVNGSINRSFLFRADLSQEVIKGVIDDVLWEDELRIPNAEDKVYRNGAVVRVDVHRAGQPVAGRAAGRRAPYLEDHDSVYHLSKPSADLLDQWSVSDRQYLAHWYGMKTMDSGGSYLKVVRYKASWPNEPSLPGLKWAYASVFSKDGTESDIKDVYVNATPEEMKQWCVDNNVAYPIPPEEVKRPWCFGVYWNSVTGAIEGVKGYVRYT